MHYSSRSAFCFSNIKKSLFQNQIFNHFLDQHIMFLKISYIYTCSYPLTQRPLKVSGHREGKRNAQT